MLDKNIYYSLLNNNDYNGIILEFRKDFIILLKEMLDYKKITYSDINFLDYYISLCQQNFTSLNDTLVTLSNTFTEPIIDTTDKINILIDIYTYIFKNYKNEILN